MNVPRAKAGDRSPKEESIRTTETVSFNPVTEDSMSNMRQKYQSTRGGNINVIKSKSGYCHLRKAIRESETRKRNMMMGIESELVPHPPIEHAAYGSELAMREAMATVSKKKEAKTEDKSAAGWAKRHLQKSKHKLSLPKSLKRKFDKTDDDFKKESNTEETTEVLVDPFSFEGLQRESKRVEDERRERRRQKTRGASGPGSVVVLSKRSRSPFRSGFKEPTKAFSDIGDTDDELDIDDMLGKDFMDQHRGKEGDDDFGQNEPINFYNCDEETLKQNEHFNATPAMKNIEEIFASHPDHHLHERLMEALDASNWAQTTFKAVAKFATQEDAHPGLQQRKAGAAKKKDPLPAYVRHGIRHAPNTDAAIKLVMEGCHSNNFWVECEAYSGGIGSGRSFRAEDVIPDPPKEKEPTTEKEGRKSQNTLDTEMFFQGKKLSKAKVDNFLAEDEKLSPAFNLLKTLYETTDTQNKLTGSLQTKLRDMDFLRADKARRRQYAFPGTDGVRQMKRDFHKDIEMMRIGTEMLRLAQTKHNIENAKWYEDITVKTRGGLNASSLTLPEKKLLTSLRHVVENGFELTEPMFLDILVKAITPSDHSSLPLQRLIKFIRLNVLKMPSETYKMWLLANKLPLPNGFEEELENSRITKERWGRVKKIVDD